VGNLWGRFVTRGNLRGYHTIPDHTYHFLLITLPLYCLLLGPLNLVTQEGHVPHFMGRRGWRPRWIVVGWKEKRLNIELPDASPKDPQESNETLLYKKCGTYKNKWYWMLEGLVGGWEVSSWADLSWSWVFKGVTLPSFSHQARVVVLSYTTERKRVSSWANFLISARYLWMTLSLSEHQARIVTFNLFLKTWKKYKEKGRSKKNEWQEDGLWKSAS